VSWTEATRAQSEAHLFLSTSVEDTVQIALLEALAMGVPSIATRVGEAPSYFPGDLARFCLPPRSPAAVATAVAALRADYRRWEERFAHNAERLRAAHSEAAAEAAIMATVGWRER
jgi:glycosyltransferase involved in cell wall biosynthesis